MESGQGETSAVREESYKRKPLDIKAIRQHLRTRTIGIGERLHYVPIVDSTNTVAMKLAQEQRAGEGTVVLTDSQTAGKGRLGRRWIDTFGYNVLSSTVLWPRFPLYLLVMLASLAVVDTIDDLFERSKGNLVSMLQEIPEVQAVIKWPNDVLLSERKVAGILVETSHDRSGRLIAILGIGVNIHELPGQGTGDTSSLLERATTLEAAYGRPVSREEFVARLIEHLEASYLSLQQEAEGFVDSNLVDSMWQFNVNPHHAARLLRERWRGRLTTLGRTVQVHQGNTLIEGIAEDVDESGELLLRSHSDERITITWGDIGYPTDTSAREHQ